MKKLILLFLIIPFVLHAQHNSGAIKLGYFNPSATDGGFILGYEGGRYIDRNLSIGWSVDWFNKNYVDESLVREFDRYYGIPNSTINELRAKTNLHDIPVLFNITGYFPAAKRTKFFLTGGIGAEVLLIFYRNFQTPDDDEFKAAFDFSWRIGFGLLYELGPRSDFFVEADYHNSKPSWTYEVNDVVYGKRTFERQFDMSGIMTRVGFRFFF